MILYTPVKQLWLASYKAWILKELRMQCINKCGKELSGRQLQFCGSRCKMAYRRNGNKPAAVTEPTVTGDDSLVTDNIGSLTRRQLYSKIAAYPNDQWISSAEHKELMRRLHTMDVQTLEQQGYWIPQWKVA